MQTHTNFRFRRCAVQSTLGMAPLNLCFNILFYEFLLSLFTRITSALFIYDRRTLLDIGHHCTNLLQDTLSTDPAWPLEILRSTEVNDGRLNNPRRRRKHRGRRAGIRNRLRKRAHSPPLPSILLANVRSLENKMDDLRARISFQWDIRDCNILCLTETWLTPMVPDTAVTPSDNFSVLRMDRTAEAGKNKGGGVCFMINRKWCDPRNISILSRSCSPHLEHLSIICRPFYLPREFTSIIVTAVYIPLQADTSLALSKLHDELNGNINKHPDSACIIAGDFNKANLSKVMPNFHQHISCPTRGQNTLDHCYTQFKNAYKARSLPAFGKSDHDAIFLTPEYKQRIVQKPPVEREVTCWSSHSEAMLQASLDDVDWDMFRASSSESSAFNTIVPTKLAVKLSDLGLNTSLCDWIQHFLTARPQVVKVGQFTSNSIILNVGAPQCCVLSPLLYSLYTHDCVSSHSSTSIVKFADDTVVLGLVSNNDEAAYLHEVERLTSWCQDNCLSLNVSKTKELIVDFRKRQQQPYTPLMISGTPVERVSSFKYLGVNLSEDLTWTAHIQTQVKKARQRLYHLRQLRKFWVSPAILNTFYSGAIESVLIQCISVWYNNATNQDCKGLQRVVRLAERISGSALPSLQDIYLKRCKSRAAKIIKDSNHPGNHHFCLLPSGKRFRSMMAKTERLRRSFFPQAIRLLKSVS